MTPVGALALALLAGCARSGEADDVCAAERIPVDVEGGGWSIGTQLPGEAGEVHVVARWPDVPGSWPIAVFAHGAWSAAGTPVDENTPTAATSEGVVAVHLDLPGGGSSSGASDQRGAASRAALAAAIQWAGGALRDLGGCTLADRAPGADPGAIVLVGTSNGGNLAVATLADTALALPDVAGLVTWETPASPVFVGVELGAEPSIYTERSCALGDAGITCAFPEDRLRAGRVEGSDVLCFDETGDDRCGDGDVVIRGTREPTTGTVYVSPELADAAAARGVLPDGFADAATADAWWAERDAARLAPALVSARPELPVIVIGSEVDHVQTLSDHPHVFGLLEALQRAGAGWTRLNPGRDWWPESDENDPSDRYTLADRRGSLLSEEAEQPRAGLFSAAVLELAERSESDDW